MEKDEIAYLIKWIFAVICCILFGILAICSLPRSGGGFLFWGFACIVMFAIIKGEWDKG